MQKTDQCFYKFLAVAEVELASCLVYGVENKAVFWQQSVFAYADDVWSLADAVQFGARSSLSVSVEHWTWYYSMCDHLKNETNIRLGSTKQMRSNQAMAATEILRKCIECSCHILQNALII